MADREEKNTGNKPEQINSKSAIKELGLEKRKKTLGERIFNWSVYQGVGWGANEVGSMAFTGMFERGKNKFVGEKRFNQISKWMSEQVTFKNGQKGAKKLLMWGSLNFIGCFVVPAIKILDDHKAGIVKWLNHTFDNKGSQAESDARDKETDLAIACEPTQTWKTLIIGRVAAMTAAIGVGYGLLKDKGNDWLMDKFDLGATKGAKFLTRKFPNSRLATAAAGEPNYFSTTVNPPPTSVNRFHYYAGLAGPETLGCLTSSTVLEIISKYAAKKYPTVKNSKLCAEALQEKRGQKQKSATASIKKPELSYAAQVSAEDTQPQRSL